MGRPLDSVEQLANYQLNRTVAVVRIPNLLLGKRPLALILIPFLLSACAAQTPQSAPVLPNSLSTPTRTAVIRSSFGNMSWVMPASWKEVIPRIWTASVGPRLFLSNAQIIDPCASSYRGGIDCWKPMTKLPTNGILVTLAGSAVAQIPKLSPKLVKIAVSQACQNMGGEREVSTFFLSLGVDACLRGPDFAANEVLFQQMVLSMKKS